MPRRDEEGEDDYQEELSDDDVRAMPSKRKKRKMNNRFLDIEAEEDDAEDEEEDDDVADLIAEDDPEVDQERQAARVEQLRRRQALDNEDPEEFLRHIQQRFGDDDDDDDAEQAAPDTSGIDQQSLLPTIRDPRLYIVRLRKPGHERKAIFTLLQKYFDMKRRGIDIGIVSAVAPENLKGIVYVEATNATSVNLAISGLDLFNSYVGVKALPLEDMTDVLKVSKRLDRQQPGNWVRRTRGLYKGDLAQVVRVIENNDNYVMLRMIPRLDIKGERDVMENADEDYEDDDDNGNGPSSALLNGKRRGRPPQKIFVKQEVMRLTHTRDIFQQRETQTGEVFDVWNGELYRHGLIYQRCSIKTLITGDDVQPQVEEVEKWIAAEKRMRFAYEDDPDSHQLSSEEVRKGLNLKFTAATGTRKTGLFKGDSVHVIKGEQKGLTGTIAGFDGNVVLIHCADFPEPLRVSREDLIKTFEAGDNVKVAEGKHAGETGSIVSVDGEFLTIFTDSTRREIRVLSSHVADSNDLNATGRRQGGGVQGRVHYELFELISLVDDNSKGVVVKVQNDGVTVLNAHNQLLVVPFNGIKSKLRDRSARAHDARGNPIAPNDSINVISGAAKDRHGIVMHVSGPTVFFRAKDEVKNCGVIAVLSSSCTAATAAARRLNHSLGGSRNMYNVPAPIPRGSMASLGVGGLMAGGRGMGGGARKSSDPLMRKQIKIIRGRWKGYRGTVISVDDKLVRVQLSSNMKTVTIQKVMVRDLEDTSTNGVGGAGTAPSGGNRLSSFGSNPRANPSSSLSQLRTPRSNGFMQTPNPGMVSRRYGASTPAHHYGTTTPHRNFDGGVTPRGHQTPSRYNRMATPSGNDAFRPTTPARPSTPSGNDNPYMASFERRHYPRQGNTPLPMTPAPENANAYASYSNVAPQTPSAANEGLSVSTPAPFSGIVEPNTPASNMVPHTPAPFGGMEPRTPANLMEPSTPAPLAAEPHTPAPGMEPATPAPGMEPTTPAPGLEPRTPMVDPTTPHTPAVPQTPMVEEDMNSGSLGYKVLIDVVVSVSTENQNSGVVIDAAADGSYVIVKMLGGPKEGDTIRLAGSEITPVQPRAEIIADDLETVKVLDGQYQGKIGHLTRVTGDDDNPEGVVKFQEGVIGMLSLSLVAKCEI